MVILFGAVISRVPFVAGSVLHRAQYLDGLRDLGHDVYLIEEIDERLCVDAAGNPCPYSESLNRALFLETVERLGLTGRACQICRHTESSAGLTRSEIAGVASVADLLINVSGHVRRDELLARPKVRVYIDQDPVYTQVWHAEYGADLLLEAHDVFFSAGLAIGTPRARVPDTGVRWHSTLPPVVLSQWQVRVDSETRPFTTVASLSGYGDIRYRREWHGGKMVGFERFADLPRLVDQEFEIAIKPGSADRGSRDLLKHGGWKLRDPAEVADLPGYREFIGRSRAEISIAKDAYVSAQSGWFSDRASHYLASGKPVLAESTGFEHILPTGDGLLTFKTLDEAVEGVNEINRRYEDHCQAARSFAAEYLDHRKVLGRLLEIACGG